MRSKWKGNFIFGFSAVPAGNFNFRKVCIPSSMVGEKLSLYDGKKKLFLRVREPMVSHRIALFFPTKRLGNAIHLKSSKRK